jgi:hypothetical protein
MLKRYNLQILLIWSIHRLLVSYCLHYILSIYSVFILTRKRMEICFSRSEQKEHLITMLNDSKVCNIFVRNIVEMGVKYHNPNLTFPQKCHF